MAVASVALAAGGLRQWLYNKITAPLATLSHLDQVSLLLEGAESIMRLVSTGMWLV
jgi:hypothetical protein